jgi:hypothetical protein
MDRHPTLRRVACLALFVAPTLAGAQWEPTARLGLSAAPDHYVDTIAPQVGDPFTLHVILTGMADDQPLDFALRSVEWVIHTVCCGDSPVGVTELVHAPGFVTEGDPYVALVSLTDLCPAGPTILLATATFEWLLEGETEFFLSAGSLTGALDCDDEGHLLQTLTVLVTGQDPSPVAASTWTGIKALFDAGKESP